MVVPEGSEFTDGTRLSWANATDVSLTLTLPNMSFTDYPVLAVETVMAVDGSVMQIAAGLYPNNTKWLAYGWYIMNVQAYPQSYQWILNGSQPEMSAGAPVLLSIALTQGRWQYRIEDLDTHVSMEGDYAPSVPHVVRAGDQEVFALESYSTSNVVFAQMGNLTLETMRINGRQIATGWYEYGGWDTHHSPLFVVGGLDPPPYIALREVKTSTLVWSYEEWTGSEETSASSSLLAILVGIPLVALVLVAALVWVTKRRMHR